MMNFAKTLLRLISGLLLVPILVVIPRNKKKIVFGAWKGLQFSDNPKYFMLYLLANTDATCIWIGDECVRSQVESVEGAKFVRKGSFAALWHCLTAGYVCCNVAFHEDVANIQLCGNVKRINLWHGIPFKNIGDAQLNGNGATNVKRRNKILTALSGINIMLRKMAYPLAAYTSASSEKMKEVYCTSMAGVFSQDRVLVCGTPRNDFLIINAANQKLKETLRRQFEQRFHLTPYDRWYLYMPTWRHGMAEDFSFTTTRRREEFIALLKSQNAVLIEKQHSKVLAAMHTTAMRFDNVLSLSEDEAKGLDVQELLLAADCLITDYSACFFDFETMHRPVIHFVYDYQNYITNDSGVIYDLRDVAAGPMAKDENELLKCMKMSDADMLRQRGRDADSPIAAERGHASEEITKWLNIK